MLNAIIKKRVESTARSIRAKPHKLIYIIIKGMVHETQCPVLKPSLEEVKGVSFEAYIQKHEKRILKMGVCKIVGEYM